jgi:hypothetical protein
MIDDICANPNVDNVRTFIRYRPPLVSRFYYEPPFAIFYRLMSPTEIQITSIRPADSVPPLSEWDKWLNG